MQYDAEAASVLRDRFGDAIVRVVDPSDDPAVAPFTEVRADRWADIAACLRDETSLAFDYLNDLCVVDYCANDKKIEKAVGEERLEVVYHLSSIARRRQLTIKAKLPRWLDGESSEQRAVLPQIASVAHLWATAEWHECEAYDLSGVEFTGHPNLRRILCPEDWVGHPLRKDYQMPLEYGGIRGR